MNEWRECKLGNIADNQTGPFGSQLHQRDYVDIGTPCIMPTNIGSNLNIITDNIAHIKEEDVKRLSKYCVREGDIIYSRRGDIEKCAFIKKEEEGWLCGTGCLRIRINTEKAIPHFVAYQLSTKVCKRWVVNNAVGTTMPNLNTGILNDLPLMMPSMDTQAHIVSILKSLDDKIAINRRICENLEAQAQALFKHWFIDFAPFKDGKFIDSELGMIPEGWRVGYLSDVLDNNKKTIKKGVSSELPYLPIDSIPMNSFLLNEVKDNSEAQSSLVLFKKDDILVGAMRVYFHRVIPAPFDGITRSTCFVLRPKCEDYFSFALCVVNSKAAIQYAQKTSKGSTMPYAIWDGGLGSYCMIIPPKSIVKDFNAILKKSIGLIQNMYFENSRLAQLRDTLLPKLMSGQIKV